jgi:hypothetical protein
MGKRRPALRDDQMAFSFTPPPVARLEGDLAGLDRMVASACARAMKEDPRSREEIAGAMAALTGEDVSRFMLDAYASEARAEHRVPADRWLALLAVTRRFDILDAVISRIGARAFVGAEVHAARLGHLMAQRDALDSEIRELRPLTRPIERGSGR